MSFELFQVPEEEDCMATIQDVLYQYHNIYADGQELTVETGANRLKGNWFELLCLWFFKHDPLYRQRFSEVWMWSDWPGRGGRPDTGIDLVASVRDGGLCAIQCKFFEPGHSVQKADIDSFLALSGQEGFTERLIVSVADDWSSNAENAIRNQQIPCTRLTLEDLDASRLDWGAFDLEHIGTVAYRPAKTLRPDQERALKAVMEGFQRHDRGKLIMACGTGKTFTALKIAEQLAGAGKTVLFLVPSISLLNQTLLAWNADSSIPLTSFAVCSDTTVGRRQRTDEDMKPTDLATPPTTNAADLLRIWRLPSFAETVSSSMTVVFSTYQSIAVLTKAQEMGFPDFDLIICDEAHRTTGVTLTGTDESNFVRVHQNKFIRGAKRLYMTATPRIFSASATTRAQEVGAVLCDMNDPSLYGPEFHRLSFSEAVRLDLLSDYKVMVLIVDQRYVSDAVTQIMAEGELKLDDAVKIVGCWKGLAKELSMTNLTDRGLDPEPMRTAVAFSSSIKNSKQFRDNFPRVIEEFKRQAGPEAKSSLNCEVRHVDGTDNICKRNALLEWLKSAPEEIRANERENVPQCRILSNARCLSEGVDIPALDAILFLNPRKSKVDVVQSVGRVMRKSPGKKFGYVIIPVMIPSNVAPEDALDRNNNFKVVWEVLQALRAHDDQFNAEVNSLDLNEGSDKVIVDVIGLPEPVDGGIDIPFPPEAWQEGVYAGIVKRCGDRQYWDQWARDMAAVADAHTTRLKSLLEQEDFAVKNAFETFLAGLRENINNNVSHEDALDMLAQHLITKPIFDAIFGFYRFSEQNPVSQAMEQMMKALESCGLESETEALANFYESVKGRIAVINNDAGRQKVIKDLYETFFKSAFPRTAERLGIVYTPIEVVDFILRSADWALRSELACPEGLSSPDVHILDPFTGTGTFLVRLLQLGLIAPEALAR
ncbi:MAG: DEAD/DEAH box helicase, partial [Fretibacterium sp.]|nr:DEAD/DEAH box helicase [Fretibacterium sp.]